MKKILPLLIILAFAFAGFSENTAASKNSIISRCAAFFKAEMMKVKKVFFKEKIFQAIDPLTGQSRTVRRGADGSYTIDMPFKQAVRVRNPSTDKEMIAELGNDGIYYFEQPVEVVKEQIIIVEDPLTGTRVEAQRQEGNVFKLKQSLQQTTVVVKDGETGEQVIAERQGGEASQDAVFNLDHSFQATTIQVRHPLTGEIWTAGLSADGSHYELKVLADLAVSEKRR